MAQSTNQNARTAHLLAQLETEIRDAFAKGLPLGDIRELVSTIVVDEQRDDTQREVPIYDEIPPGLVTSEEAAKKYGISTSTIRTWVDRGHLAVEACLKASARGGGKLLVSGSELNAQLASPRNKSGRPRTT